MRQVILTIFFASIFVSCGGTESYKDIKWNPDFYLHNVNKNYAINEKNHKVSFTDNNFANYASMHMTKIIELNTLLKTAKVKRSNDNKKLDVLYSFKVNTDKLIKAWLKREEGKK